jgi:hypothetical protein
VQKVKNYYHTELNPTPLYCIVMQYYIAHTSCTNTTIPTSSQHDLMMCYHSVPNCEGFNLLTRSPPPSTSYPLWDPRVAQDAPHQLNPSFPAPSQIRTLVRAPGSCISRKSSRSTRNNSISTTHTTSSSNKSVKFVDEPIVHYASVGYWSFLEKMALALVAFRPVRKKAR